MPKQCVFQQVGYPVLTFRNLEWYEGQFTNTEKTLQPTGVRRFWEHRRKQAIQLSRFYNPLLDGSDRKERNILPPREEKLPDNDGSQTSLLCSDMHLRQSHEDEMERLKRITSTQFDLPYVRTTATKRRGVTGLIQKSQFQGIVDCAQQRSLCAFPSYHAPFRIQDMEWCLRDEKCRESSKHEVLQRKKRKKTVNPSVKSGDVNRMSTFQGNCLVCFPCFCHYCKSTCTPSVCVLHPKGIMLDTLCLSFACTDATLVKGRENVQHKVNGCVRQIIQIGYNLFLVRSDVTCAVYRVDMESQGMNDECSYRATLIHLFDVDTRMAMQDTFSYIPIHVARNPHFGGSHWRPLVSILSSQIQNGSAEPESSYIHVVQPGDESVTQRHHGISNLQRISHIEYSSSHPMVLWASAQSHIRPGLTTHVANQIPRMGHGTSLFTVDLRTKKGTFQWSPSHHKYQIEGTHSLSGLSVDECNECSLWVASESACMTWEIDSRMPCKCLNSWSIAHVQDEVGTVLPPTGYYGSGFIFHQSSALGPSKPFFGVSQTPGASHLHLYQRSQNSPRFQTDSIESSAEQKLFDLASGSINTCSTFGLPDVGASTFICGLASCRMGGIYPGCSNENDSSCAVVLTLTNRGDVYAHTFLEETDSSTTEFVQSVERHHEQFVYGPQQNLMMPIFLSTQPPIPGDVLFPVCKEATDNAINTLEATRRTANRSSTDGADWCRSLPSLDTSSRSMLFQHHQALNLQDKPGDVALRNPYSRSDITTSILHSERTKCKKSVVD